GFLTPMAPPMTKAMATKASQPQIAFLRCWALQRPARAAKVFECMRAMSRWGHGHAIRVTGVFGVGVALRPRNDQLLSTDSGAIRDVRPPRRRSRRLPRTHLRD